MKEGGINDTLEATRIAKEMHTLLSQQNPVIERADVNLFHSVAAPGRRWPAPSPSPTSW